MKKDMSVEHEGKNDNGGRVKVFVRLKPCFDQERFTSNITADGQQLHVQDPQGRVDHDRWHKFDRIYSTSSSNKEVYKKVGHSMVEGVVSGFNGALFAYGQTGSGKTHTLMSKDGMSAHMVSHLFSKIWNDSKHEYKVTCSYLQIYQERIYDLLNSNPKLDFSIREDPHLGSFVENISSFVCHSPNDVYTLLNIGRKRLVFGETRMNRLSSRSHAICQLVIEKKKKRSDQEQSPIEVSSPKHNKPAADIPQLDFETIPYRQSSLKKRHSIAVSKPTNRNSINLSTNLYKHRVTTPGRSSSTLKPSAAANIKKRYSVNLDRACSPEISPRSHTPEPRLNRSVTSSSFRSLKRISVNLEEGANCLTIRRSSRPETPDLSRLESFMQSNTSMLSNELSVSTDSVIDDMQWQMEESTADISKAFAESCSTQEDMADDYKDLDLNQSMDSFGDAQGDNESVLLRSKLSIIDLAGSERVKKSQATGERLNEAQHINLSLHELGNVVSALVDRNRTHIPYRNSILTRLLQDSLGGNCKTSFILCTSTMISDLHETKCTLEFGQRLQKVMTQPKINVEVDYKRLCEELQSKLKVAEEAHKNSLTAMQMQLDTAEEIRTNFEKELDSVKAESASFENELHSVTDVKGRLENELDLLQIKQARQEKLCSHKDEKLIEMESELNRLIEEHKDKNKINACTNTRRWSTRDASTSSANLAQLNHVDVETNTEQTATSHVAISPIPCLFSVAMDTIAIETEKLFLNKSVSTSPKHAVSRATSPVHSLKNIELQRMRNVLLAELMSLQLLYSMFDCTVYENEEDKETLQKDILLQIDDNSAASATPSGYETGSHSDIPNENFHEISRNVTPDYFKLPNIDNSFNETSMIKKLRESYTPKSGGLLEEIIEAQLSGSLQSPSTICCLLSVEERIAYLRREISNHKKSIDDELVKLAGELLEDDDITEEGGRVQKRGIYSQLVQKLSDPETCSALTIEQLEQILNLVLVDHSLTGCLLALSHKLKNTKMMRRLSSSKSTQKSLLDYIDIDQELCGYENQGVLFNDDEQEIPDTDSVDNVIDYVPPSEHENVTNTESETSEMSSGSECGSPIVQKKGLRRFFCMPMKSMTGARRSFRKRKTIKPQ